MVCPQYVQIRSGAPGYDLYNKYLNWMLSKVVEVNLIGKGLMIHNLHNKIPIWKVSILLYRESCRYNIFSCQCKTAELCKIFLEFIGIYPPLFIFTWSWSIRWNKNDCSYITDIWAPRIITFCSEIISVTNHQHCHDQGKYTNIGGSL